MVANLFKKLEFKEEFINLVQQKVKEYFESGQKDKDGQKQALINKKIAIEVKRDRLEDRLLDNTITRDVFQRKHAEIQAQLTALDTRMFTLEQRRDMNVEVLDEILSFSRDIYATYKAAQPLIKQHYLKFFFDKFMIQDKKIAKTVHSLLFEVLLREEKIILRGDLLPNPEILRATIDKILRAFENVIQMELIKIRWVEIKKFQLKPSL